MKLWQPYVVSVIGNKPKPSSVSNVEQLVTHEPWTLH